MQASEAGRLTGMKRKCRFRAFPETAFYIHELFPWVSLDYFAVRATLVTEEATRAL